MNSDKFTLSVFPVSAFHRQEKPLIGAGKGLETIHLTDWEPAETSRFKRLERAGRDGVLPGPEVTQG